VIAVVVYVLCALTAAACAYLLLRGYGRTRVRLLLWSGICFIGLPLNNVMVVVDVVVLPTVDLWPLRVGPALVGVVAMIYGLVNEST